MVHSVIVDASTWLRLMIEAATTATRKTTRIAVQVRLLAPRVPTHTIANNDGSNPDGGTKESKHDSLHYAASQGSISKSTDGVLSLLWQVVLLEECIASELLFFDFCNHFPGVHSVIENTIHAQHWLFDRYFRKGVTVR